MVKKGFEELLRSQVKMKPLLWPAATVVWSAEIARAETDPHSEAVGSVSKVETVMVKILTWRALANDMLKILLIIK